MPSSPPGPAASEPGVPRPPAPVTDADMQAAAASGQVVQLSQTITFIVRYHDTWWLSAPGAWLPIPAPVASVLDHEAERLRAQDAVVASRAAIRGLIALARDATISPDQRQL